VRIVDFRNVRHAGVERVPQPLHLRAPCVARKVTKHFWSLEVQKNRTGQNSCIVTL
jgi:hypothetical protein